jgi:hypothetical protein
MSSLDDKLAGWDAALAALTRQLEVYKARARRRGEMVDVAMGWDDAIHVASKLRGDARTQKGFLARECAAIEPEPPAHA